jgi:hypothetical protein
MTSNGALKHCSADDKSVLFPKIDILRTVLCDLEFALSVDKKSIIGTF